MTKFQDREDVLDELCTPAPDSLLLNVFGETGIGKSSVLQEAARQLREEKKPPALVLWIDLENFKDAADRPTAVLRALIDQAEGRVSGIWQSNEQVAAVVVAQLGALALHTPVYLMFDTTEALQEDGEFWDWLHQNLTEPLVIAGRVKQVYAGRIPVAWRRFELRRTVKLLPLGPITPVKASRALVEQVLLHSNPTLRETEELQPAIDIVLEFSFGHPLLSERLARYVAQHWPPTQPLAQFKVALCAEEVALFIDQALFADIEPPWNEILWWASVLDWFDPTILQQYIEEVMPEMKGKPDYFFIREVARLRMHNTVVWQEKRGDRLHGLIQDIVRRCLRTVDITRYRYACEAAAKTFESIAKEFSAEDSYAEQFKNEAEIYRQRLLRLEEITA
jgi:hypothetical protein